MGLFNKRGDKGVQVDQEGFHLGQEGCQKVSIAQDRLCNPGNLCVCRMFDEEYVEWENATTKCQELGARLPVLSDAETIKIVKKYLETAEFEVFEVKKGIVTPI